MIVILNDEYYKAIPVGSVHNIANKLSTIYNNKLELMMVKAETNENPYFNEFGQEEDMYDIDMQIDGLLPAYKNGVVMNTGVITGGMKSVKDDTVTLKTWSNNLSKYLGRRIDLYNYTTIFGGNNSENIVETYLFIHEKIIISTIKHFEDNYTSYYMEPLCLDDLERNIDALKRLQ